MPKWEYVVLELEGHRSELRSANNMIVSSSDGRYSAEQMPKDVLRLLNEYGAEGWEYMPEASIPTLRGMSVTTYLFRRPLVED